MSDTSTITDSGGAVSQVADKSDKGRNFVQGVGANQPITGSRTLNGLNVLDFDTTKWLEHTADAANLFPVNTDINLFAIASRDISDAEDIFFYFKDGVAGVTASTSVYDGLGSGGADVLEVAMMFDDFQNHCRNTFQDSTNWSTLPPTADEYQLAEGGEVPIFLSQIERGSGTRYLRRWVNGLENENTIPSAQNGNVCTTSVIGGHGSLGTPSRRLDGVVAEIIVTHGTLTLFDRRRVEGYFAHKWGLTAQLAADHPYKNEPPV